MRNVFWKTEPEIDYELFCDKFWLHFKAYSGNAFASRKKVNKPEKLFLENWNLQKFIALSLSIDIEVNLKVEV